ncbi:T9SS C-terminal target domain-containing protein [candidate division KSB1 bacterium]|nr:MAG: T9SS C-terminal target domain-containing protein [candidate division KSB1 bacterium]
MSYAQETKDVILHFDPDRGFYQDNFDLTLLTTPPGLTIKYTKDGTNPVTSSTAIQGTSPIIIHIDPAHTEGRDRAPGYCVRAVAIQADTAVTNVKTFTYLFVNRVVELSPDGLLPGPGWLRLNNSSGQAISYGMDRQVCNNSLYKDKIADALTDIPSFSMVMDLKDLFDPATGIYVNATEYGREWERPCSIELIYPDGTDGFQMNCGVRIRGGWSRNKSNPKRAFRWFFRKEYGEGKLKYPLFEDEGVDEFDHMDLRTAMNYSWSYGAEGPEKNTFLRDVFCRDLQRDMGQPYTRSRYYHLYINGTYWGLYQTQERSEASYASDYLGGAPEDYDVVKVDGGFQGAFVIEATDGNLDAWRRLWEASMGGFETNEVYYKVQGLNPDGTRHPDYEVLLDVDNLIDFMINVFITGDGDAPASSFTNGPNNFYSLYNRNGDWGFIHFRHDAEHTLGAQPWAEDRTGPFNIGGVFEKSNPQWIHQKLCENPLYVNRFANHVYKHFFNGGAVTPEVNLARILARKKQIDLAIIAESARWGDSKREPAFTRDDGWLQAVNYIIEDFLPNRTNVVLSQLRSKGWYPRTDPPTFNSESNVVPRGFQLTMKAPRGQIYYTTDGTDPYQPLSVSTSYATLIMENAAKKVLVPTAAIQNAWRQSLEFDDSAWRSGSGNIGYEQGQGYENMINIDVGADMVNKQTSCYVRIPFFVDEAEIDSFNILTLRMRYDDGFVVWLNGEKVAEVNAPTSLTWNASATNNHEAETWEPFDMSGFVNKLIPGQNLLAIQGLNVELNSSDFLIGTELVAGIASNSGEISENALQYSEPLVIEETIQVKARVFDNVDWSAVHEATFWVLQGIENLRITEIHYHPLDQGDDQNDDGEYEFIEMKNIGDETLDLSGLYFSRGITYLFPNDTMLGPDEFIVLASNKSAFFSRYGFQAFGEYEGQLDNNGETLALNSAAEDTIIKIRYTDQYPWPNSADGDGYSVVPRQRHPYQDQNEAVNWIASREIHGNPGRDNIPVSAKEPEQQATPADYQLWQNYPNPFNAVTTIQFHVPTKTFLTIKLYNILGEEVDELVSQYFEPGHHSVKWHASDFASGLYFFQLTTSTGYKQSKKLVLLK